VEVFEGGGNDGSQAKLELAYQPLVPSIAAAIDFDELRA